MARRGSDAGPPCHPLPRPPAPSPAGSVLQLSTLSRHWEAVPRLCQTLPSPPLRALWGSLCQKRVFSPAYGCRSQRLVFFKSPQLPLRGKLTLLRNDRVSDLESSDFCLSQYPPLPQTLKLYLTLPHVSCAECLVLPLNVQLLRTDQPLALHGNQSFVVFFKLRFIGPPRNTTLGALDSPHPRRQTAICAEGRTAAAAADEWGGWAVNVSPVTVTLTLTSEVERHVHLVFPFILRAQQSRPPARFSDNCFPIFHRG